VKMNAEMGVRHQRASSGLAVASRFAGSR